MNILTKIFVVLVTVLALLLVAVIVPYVSSVSNVKDELADMQQELTVAQDQAKLREISFKAALQEKVSEIQKFQDQNASLMGQVDGLLSKLSQREAELISTRASLQETLSIVSEATSGSDQGQKIIANLQAEVISRRDQSLELQRKNIELNNELQDRLVQIDSYDQQVRLFKEQMADLQQQNRSLQKNGSVKGSGDAVQAGAILPSSPVRGSITKVFSEGDQIFIEINVGSNDQVRQGMEFMIHTGGSYIGNAVITKVDINSSAGRVTLVTGGAEITTRLEVLAGGF